jgi:hypothetical protein
LREPVGRMRYGTACAHDVAVNGLGALAPVVGSLLAGRIQHHLVHHRCERAHERIRIEGRHRLPP